jgi:hypothetical protein
MSGNSSRVNQVGNIK